MADVAIIHSPDKAKAAARLAESVAAAGFSVGAAEVENPAGLANALENCGADARILIWSRPLVSHALHSGELARIRQLQGLIEVSADGIAPPARGDETRVVSISGWRGQPFHPGWQRIALELKRLCGLRKAAPEPALPPAFAREDRADGIAPAPSNGGGVAKGRRLMLGGAAAVLLAAGASAAIWFGPSDQDSTPLQALRETASPTPAPASTTQPSNPGAEPPEAPVGPPPLQALAPPSSSGPPAADAAQSEAFRPKPGPGAARLEPVARAKQRTPPRSEPAKKYSRKNSKVMRQFCERSGRSTSQCRTFLRSTSGAEAD